MNMYQIDEGGETHWIVARDREGALGILATVMLQAGIKWAELSSHDVGVEILAPSAPFSYAFPDSGKVKASVADWLTLYDAPAYVACSAF